MRRTVVFAGAALEVFETLGEARVVRTVLELAEPGTKLSMAEIASALGWDVKQVKRSLAAAISNDTLVVVPIEGYAELRTYRAGGRLAGLFFWGQYVPESDNPQPHSTEQRLSDWGHGVPKSRPVGGAAA